MTELLLDIIDKSLSTCNAVYIMNNLIGFTVKALGRRVESYQEASDSAKMSSGE
jgi:hypothetical protein